MQGVALMAQQPALEFDKPVVLLNGTAHLGNGTVMEYAAIGMEGGKISFVADARTLRLDPEAVHIIDATGKHIYPGLIASNSTLGLVEVDAVRATRDFTEVGDFNPHIRSLIAYNTDSRIIPTVRANGVLLALAVPRGGTISGSSSLMELDGWNWEDAVHTADVGIHLRWPAMYRITGWWAEPGSIEQEQKWLKAIGDIYQFFDESKAYLEAPPVRPVNLRFEAMRGIFDGTRRVFIHADFAQDILNALEFVDRYALNAVLVGGRDSWIVADELKKRDIPVIFSDVHTLPARIDDDVHQIYKTPKALHDAGVKVALAVKGMGNGSWEQRNLSHMAGTAVAYGLDAETALKMIALFPAEILGVAGRLGTLEEAKDATIIVTSGDLLDMRGSIVERAFIRGREIDLDNHQKQLYERYMRKYGIRE
jgi:imidazolonepropionase-like amidohydrolase